MTGRLRLLATDPEELSLISAALQNAVFKVGDMAWNAARGELTLSVNRFCWETGGRKRQRVRTAIQFGSVRAVRSRRVRLTASEAVLELLEVSFTSEAEGPGGTVDLILAGGGDIQFEVECIDTILSDVSEPWPTAHRPGA